jgi:Uma2 family endonuclease
MTTKPRATVDDLYQVEGKAELVNGEIVQMSPTGDVPSRAASAINARLRGYEASAKTGRAYGDNTGFLVRLPGRQSFSPDVAFYVGPRFGGKFLEGAPVFAVEVRSEGDYGPSAEREMAAKRADYFAAGTQVVWDVDVLRGELIRVFRATDPETPVVFGRRETADAEPALPGFRMLVDEIFE